MDKPIKQYIQDLMIDTVNAVTHLDTTLRIALSHKKCRKSKIKDNKHFTENKYNKNMCIRKTFKQYIYIYTHTYIGINQMFIKHKYVITICILT